MNHPLLPFFPTDCYQELDPARCSADHPPAIVAARSCPTCEASNRRFRVWPSYCHVCHTERMHDAWKRMEQEGLICLVCLPMYANRLGQIRPLPGSVSKRPGGAASMTLD